MNTAKRIIGSVIFSVFLYIFIPPVYVHAAVSSLSDNFDRTSLGPDWVVLKGTFGINAQTLFQWSGSPDGGLAVSASLTGNDYDLEMDTFYTDAMAARGFVARYQDIGNYYYGKVGRNGDVAITKVQGGVKTTLGLYDGPWITQNTWHRIKLKVEGTSLKLYLDGALKLQVQDSTFSSGKVGIWADSYYVRFDNFSLTVLSSTPTVTPPAVNPAPSFTNQNQITLSGTKSINTSIWINNIQVVSLDSSTSWSYQMILAQEGLNSFVITAKDSSGNESAPVNVSTTFDATRPIGTITIAGGNPYTNTAAVQLTITQTEANPDKMRISVDGGVTWGNGWILYASNAQITFPAGDGLKEVRVEFQDKAGNTTTGVISDTITLDTFPPQIVFTSTQLTNNASYTLIYTADGVPKSKSVILTIEGNNVLSVTETDPAGNLTTKSYAVTLDTQKPTITNTTTNNLTFSQVTISWATDEDSTTQIEYGATASYGSFTTLDAQLTKNHSQTITGLQANTIYYYRVKSKDQAGNEQISAQATFTTQTSPVTEPGLAGYWNFDAVFNNTISDQSGNGNAGTLVNGVIQSADHPIVNFTNSGSLSFDGVDDYVQVPNSNNLNFGSGNFTISIWIRPDTVTKLRQGIVDKTDGTNGYRLITSDADGDRLKFIRGAYFADGVQSNDGVLKASVWQHVAIVISANQVTFYVNGINQGSGALKAYSALTSTNLFIGQKGFSASSVSFFDGNMDDLRIYNRALSASEIQILIGTIVDTTPPTGSIIINNNAPHTNSLSLNLTLTAVDSGSGIDKMSFSENNSIWSPLILFQSSYIYSLSPGEGSRTLYVKFYDKAGNASQAYPKGIIVDTVPPKVLLTSSQMTNQIQYTLTYTIDGTQKQESVTLTDGENVIDRTFSDPAGNETQVTWGVTLDRTIPIITGPSEIYFTPNGDLKQDTAQITGQISESSDWKIDISNSSQIILKSFQGIGSSFSVIWDGINSLDSKPYPDGIYAAKVTAKDPATNDANPLSVTITLSTNQETERIFIYAGDKRIAMEETIA